MRLMVARCFLLLMNRVMEEIFDIIVQAAALKSQQTAQASAADYSFAAALNSVVPLAGGADLQALMALANAQRVATQQQQQQNALQLQAAALSTLLSQATSAQQLPMQVPVALPGAVPHFQNPMLASQLAASAMLAPGYGQSINSYGQSTNPYGQQQGLYGAQQQQSSPAVARLLQQMASAQAQAAAVMNPPMGQPFPATAMLRPVFTAPAVTSPPAAQLIAPHVLHNPMYSEQLLPQQGVQQPHNDGAAAVQHGPVSPP